MNCDVFETAGVGVKLVGRRPNVLGALAAWL